MSRRRVSEPDGIALRPGDMPPRPRRAWRTAPASAVLLVALAAAGCGTIGGSPTTGSPTPGRSASPSPVDHGIGHRTGATDLILRVEDVGGFVAPSARTARVPTFSLFGDGTVVVRDPNPPPAPPADGIGRTPPLRVLHFAEARVQDVLALAIGPGGLGIAQAQYLNGGVADAPSTVFTIHTTDVDKTVTVDALGIETSNTPDPAIRSAFKDLVDQLTALARSGAPYAPAVYRGILEPGDPGRTAAAVAWPWPALKPADFRPADANFPDVVTHALSAADVAALKVSGLEGGGEGIPVTGPDGRTPFLLSLRPLLPDESS